MCKLKCEIRASKNYHFHVGDYDINVATGSTNRADISKYNTYSNERLHFSNMAQLKYFCESILACLDKIENES